jgi:DNA-binding response OmpR family regulator
MARLLLIDDNADLVSGLRTSLETEGYEVDVASDSVQGVDRGLHGDYDLIVVDLMLHGLDGFRVLRTIAEQRALPPVLVLSAQGGQAGRLARTLFPRSAAIGDSAPAAGVIRRGAITIDLAARQVFRSGQPVELRKREFELLVALAESPGVVLSRERLLREVWGYHRDVRTRTVDVHVAQLRRKTERDPEHPHHIITVERLGYRFDP